MMQNCWNNSLSERPHFNDIVMDLNNFLDKNSFENTEEECSLSFESGTQLPRDTGTGKNSFLLIMSLRNSPYWLGLR